MAKSIPTKCCSHCKQVREASEFTNDKSRKDGLNPWCKTCQRLKRKAYDQTEAGKLNYSRYAKSPKGKLRDKRYAQSGKGKKTFAAATMRYRQTIKGKEKIPAQNAVNNAIRAGKLPRPDSLQCTYCPKQAREYHHYLGYAKEYWFDIEPVCSYCHKNLDKKE